ncbi:DUF317 domain-containing protein [Streptomyces sp. NPDC017413]|uniref:DUF317 domain-containing protein n=1 Tax=unclassified Streptomyces TaxID=2593676 RepID=UPI003795FA1F
MACSPRQRILGDAGVLLVAFAASRLSQTQGTWTIWAGPGPDRPTWTLTASPHSPSSLLSDLSETLAHDTGLRRPKAAGTGRRTSLVTDPPTVPVVAASLEAATALPPAGDHTAA